MKIRLKEREGEREKRNILDCFSVRFLELNGFQVCFGEVFLLYRGREREKEGFFFVFVEISLLSRYFVCYLKFFQGTMLSFFLRGYLDVGFSCFGFLEYFNFFWRLKGIGIFLGLVVVFRGLEQICYQVERYSEVTRRFGVWSFKLLIINWNFIVYYFYN